MNVFRLTLVAVVLMMTSCSSDLKEEEVNNEEVKVPVTVRVKGFTVEQSDFPVTRGGDKTVDEYANLKALTLAFYKSDGTELYKATQYKNDKTTYETFSVFSTSLPIGSSYTMVVIGSSAADEAHHVTLDAATSASYSDYVRETFSVKQTVTISSNEPVSLEATLDRVYAQVTVQSTDGRTEEVKSIRTIFSGGSMSFNPLTGLASDNNGLSKTVVTTKAVGETTEINNALFLASDKQTMDITVQTLDKDGNVIFSEVVKDVALQRNKITTLTGRMYSADATTSPFTLHTDWLPGNEVTF